MAEKRQARRRATIYKTALRTGYVRLPATILDVSVLGCQIRTPAPLRRGERITIEVAGQQILGTIMRVDGHRSGAEFDAVLTPGRMAALLSAVEDGEGPEAPPTEAGAVCNVIRLDAALARRDRRDPA